MFGGFYDNMGMLGLNAAQITLDKLAAIRRIQNQHTRSFPVQELLEKLSPVEVFWLERNDELVNLLYGLTYQNPRNLAESLNEPGGAEIYVGDWPTNPFEELSDVPYIGFSAAVKELPDKLSKKAIPGSCFSDDIVEFEKAALHILLRRVRLEIWKQIIRHRRIGKNAPSAQVQNDGHNGTYL